MVSLVSSATRLQISTELVIKEERAHVEWKPSQWSCCWVGRDVSQVKLSKFTVHVLHCLPEFVHSLLIDMVLCLSCIEVSHTLLNLHSFLMLVVWWLLLWHTCKKREIPHRSPSVKLAMAWQNPYCITKPIQHGKSHTVWVLPCHHISHGYMVKPM